MGPIDEYKMVQSEGSYPLDARYPDEFKDIARKYMDWNDLDWLDRDHNRLSKSYINKPDYTDLRKRWDALHPYKAKFNNTVNTISNAALAGFLGTGLAVSLSKHRPIKHIDKIVYGVGLPSMAALPITSWLESREEAKDQKIMDLTAAARLEVDNARRRDLAHHMFNNPSFRSELLHQLATEKKALKRLNAKYEDADYDVYDSKYNQWNENVLSNRATLFKKHGLLKNYTHGIDLDDALLEY